MSNLSDSFNVYPPRIPEVKWRMCSRREGDDRQVLNEISIFECTDDTAVLPITRRIPDGKRCVQKYRRSAAGQDISCRGNTGTNERRELFELYMTVNYLLLCIFPYQRTRQYPTRQNGDYSAKMKIESLCSTANFIDDRIRAIQVDLTRLFGIGVSSSSPSGIRQIDISKVRGMQIKVIRYNILTQYLLSGLVDPRLGHKNKTIGKVKNKYEWNFANTQLRTAISLFFSVTDKGFSIGDSGMSLKEKEIKMAHIDEVMSYASLLHITCLIRERETSLPSATSVSRRSGIISEDGNGMSAILMMYQKHVNHEENKKKNKICSSSYPRWSWTLKVASALETGNYLRVLRLLALNGSNVSDTKNLKDRICNSVTTHQYAEGNENKLKEFRLPLSPLSRWIILARCCLAQSIPLLRIAIMRQYNKSLNKREKLSGQNLSQLLHLPTPEAAIKFCQKIGLPTSSSMTGSKIHNQVIMKIAPISVTGEDSIRELTDSGRQEDTFVFGPEYEKAWVVTSTYMNSKIENHSTLNWGSFSSRVDEDNVKVLPSPVLWELIR